MVKFKSVMAAALAGAAMLGAGAAHAQSIKLVKQVAPDYPRGAERRGVEGKVVVEYTVQADGTVADAQVVEATPPGVFDSAAVKAVERWRYEKPGAPTSVRAEIAFNL